MTNAMKKGLCALAIALTLLPLGMIAHAGDMPTVPLTPTRVVGDANDDGTVDLKDAAALARHLAGGWNVTIKEKKCRRQLRQYRRPQGRRPHSQIPCGWMERDAGLIPKSAYRI